jgi:hypothetical protein
VSFYPLAFGGELTTGKELGTKEVGAAVRKGAYRLSLTLTYNANRYIYMYFGLLYGLKCLSPFFFIIAVDF